MSTKSIALIAATRRSKAQDREAGSHRSPHHPPEGRRGPSPADGGWPCTSCSRGSSVERKARMGRSPALTQSLQQVGGRWSWWSSPRGPAGGRGKAWQTEGPRHQGAEEGPPGPLPTPRWSVSGASRCGCGFWSGASLNTVSHVFSYLRQKGALLGLGTPQANDTCVRGGLFSANHHELLRLPLRLAPGGHAPAPMSICGGQPATHDAAHGHFVVFCSPLNGHVGCPCSVTVTHNASVFFILSHFLGILENVDLWKSLSNI